MRSANVATIVPAAPLVPSETSRSTDAVHAGIDGGVVVVVDVDAAVVDVDVVEVGPMSVCVTVT